jgi:hypothetical protein
MLAGFVCQLFDAGVFAGIQKLDTGNRASPPARS